MLEIGILKNFDDVNYRASVQLVGSLTTYFDNVRVARNIPAGEMVLGRHVFIAIPDNNPGNAAIIAVFDP
jgi:hypothetical protein